MRAYAHGMQQLSSTQSGMLGLVACALLVTAYNGSSGQVNRLLQVVCAAAMAYMKPTAEEVELHKFPPAAHSDSPGTTKEVERRTTTLLSPSYTLHLYRLLCSVEKDGPPPVNRPYIACSLTVVVRQ